MNASTYIYVCQHNTEDDARYMSKKLGVATIKIPRVPLHFLIWTPGRGEIADGHVEFSAKGRPRFLQSGAKIKQLNVSASFGKFDGLNYS